jgi:hypothetical protein
VPDGAARPIIFVDIDGVLIPLRARPGRTKQLSDCGVERELNDAGNPLLGRLDAGDGQRLQARPGELVWATSWMAEANEVVAPLLALPHLQYVDWPDDDEEPPIGVHWKTQTVTRWAAGRAFVWLDDEITAVDQRWVATHH